jgi:LCP family protein required for cell wall assembly
MVYSPVFNSGGEDRLCRSLRVEPVKIHLIMSTRLARTLLAGLILAGVASACRTSVPLGPGLELATHTPAPMQATEETAATPDTAPSVPTPAAQPVCGGVDSLLILAVGADNRDDTYLYGLADVIRLVRVDFVDPKVTSLSFPRDIWVRIPGIDSHYGITHGKLNQAYLYGNPGMGYYEGPGAGPGLLARTLDENFGAQPEQYVAVNMQTFVKLVDAVGGIDLYLPQAVDGRPVDDHTEDMGYFPAGQHHFTGDQALRFSRIRKVDNAFKRDERQSQVLCALKERLQSPEIIPRIPAILSAFSGSVLTDLSLAQMTQLACLLPYLDGEDIIFESVPESMLVGGRNDRGSFVLTADEQTVRQLVASFVAGTWPTEPDEPTCP